MTPSTPPPTPIAIVARCDYGGGSTTATVELHIQCGVWPKPVYICGDPKQARLPAGQRVRILQRVGAGYETFDGVVGSDGKTRVNGEVINGINCH
jgi:hypothetical protein